MTFLLIISSVWMVLALEAIQVNNKARFNKFLGLTILGGAMFLGCQAYEWTHLLGHWLPELGISFSSSLFASTFFILTGFHGMHVTGGVIFSTFSAGQRSIEAAMKRSMWRLPGSIGTSSTLLWILIFHLSFICCNTKLKGERNIPVNRALPLPGLYQNISISASGAHHCRGRDRLPGPAEEDPCSPHCLVSFAVWKAALVAMHFMHLKLRRKEPTAVVGLWRPLFSCVFLILMLMPDIFTPLIAISELPSLNAALNSY